MFYSSAYGYKVILICVRLSGLHYNRDLQLQPNSHDNIGMYRCQSRIFIGIVVVNVSLQLEILLKWFTCPE